MTFLRRLWHWLTTLPACCCCGGTMGSTERCPICAGYRDARSGDINRMGGGL